MKPGDELPKTREELKEYSQELLRITGVIRDDVIFSKKLRKKVLDDWFERALELRGAKVEEEEE